MSAPGNAVGLKLELASGEFNLKSLRLSCQWLGLPGLAGREHNLKGAARCHGYHWQPEWHRLAPGPDSPDSDLESTGGTPASGSVARLAQVVFTQDTASAITCYCH